jgi:hypothetical protein
VSAILDNAFAGGCGQVLGVQGRRAKGSQEKCCSSDQPTNVDKRSTVLAGPASLGWTIRHFQSLYVSRHFQASSVNKGPMHKLARNCFSALLPPRSTRCDRIETHARPKSFGSQ